MSEIKEKRKKMGLGYCSIGWVPALHAGVLTVNNNWRGENEAIIMSMHGICRGFNRFVYGSQSGLVVQSKAPKIHVNRN